MSLQLRVAILAVVGSMLAVAIVSVGAWAGMRDATHDEADASVRSLANAMAGAEGFEGASLMRECRSMSNAVPIEATSEAGPLQQAMWVVDSSGRACSLDGSATPADVVEIGRDSARRQRGSRPADFELESTHVVARAAPSGERTAIVAARSVEEADRVLRRLEWLLVLLAGIVGLLALGTGLLIVRMLARPVLSIAREVEQVVSVGDPSVRLDDRMQPEEVRPLVSRINELLAGLEHDHHRRRERAADASHDARSPLTSLRASIELLSLGEDAGIPAAEARAILTDAAHELDELTESIRDLERCIEDPVAAGDTPVELAVLVREVARRARRRHPARQVEVEVRGSAATVVGSARDLDRAVWNLVHNALHHAGQDARVLVTCEGPRIEVRDDGIGIPPHELTTVMRRHGRGSTALETGRPGSGIGLALAARVVDEHGGELRLHSDEHGTTATIDFAARVRPATRGSSPPARVAASAPRRSPA